MIDILYLLFACITGAAFGMSLGAALWAALYAAYWLRLRTSALGFVASLYGVALCTTLCAAYFGA